MEQEEVGKFFGIELTDVELARTVELWVETRDRLWDEVEELRKTISTIEKQVRRLEREIAMYDKLIEGGRVGKLGFGWEPRPEELVNLSIPDAAEKAIQLLRRPLHVREILDVLEAGGKRFKAARPTVSIASALSRDARFVRVGPNLFDLVERTQPRLPIEE